MWAMIIYLFIYLFSTPSFFDVGHVYFWRACCVWKRYLDFPNQDYFQKNSFLKEAISDWDFIPDFVWFFQQHRILISDWSSLKWHNDVSCQGWIQLWLGLMDAQLFRCHVTAWLHMCSSVRGGEEMGLYFPKAPAPLVISVPVCCSWLPKKMPSRKLEIHYLNKQTNKSYF